MNIRKMKFKVRLYIEPDDGGFYVYCPELKGLHVSGATEEEAMQNGRDAVVAYLDSVMAAGDPIPVGVLHSDETQTFGELAGMMLNKAFGLNRPARRQVLEEFDIGNHAAA